MIATHEERAPRCIQDIMAYPYFALAKRKTIKPIKFTSVSGDVHIHVEGLQSFGIASIYDADVLLWLCAELRRNFERTGVQAREVFFNPYVLMKQTGRAVGGRQVESLKAAIKRLYTTSVMTTVRQEHQTDERGFHWIDAYSTRLDNVGMPKGLWAATLPDWLVEGVYQDRNILTLHPGYYRLASGLDKRLYLIAKKHAGRQAFGTFITMPVLQEKVGSTDQAKVFAYQIRQIAREKGQLLDYSVAIVRPADSDGEKVWLRHQSFANKGL